MNKLDYIEKLKFSDRKMKFTIHKWFSTVYNEKENNIYCNLTPKLFHENYCYNGIRFLNAAEQSAPRSFLSTLNQC